MPIVWEAEDDDGQGVLSDWDLPAKLAAKLDEKVDKLRTAEVDSTGRPVLPHGMFAGPVHGQRGIYKLIVNGDRALRPMVAKDNEGNWVVLTRCEKRDNDTRPEKRAAQLASTRLAEVLAGTRSRREYS